jgi:hypothetical protein
MPHMKHYALFIPLIGEQKHEEHVSFSTVLATQFIRSKNDGALFIEQSLAHNGSHVANSVHHYFKLPSSDKRKCTQWKESVKLC